MNHLHIYLRCVYKVLPALKIPTIICYNKLD